MAIDTTKLPGWETTKDITTTLAAGSLTISQGAGLQVGHGYDCRTPVFRLHQGLPEVQERRSHQGWRR